MLGFLLFIMFGMLAGFIALKPWAKPSSRNLIIDKITQNTRSVRTLQMNASGSFLDSIFNPIVRESAATINHNISSVKNSFLQLNQSYTQLKEELKQNYKFRTERVFIDAATAEIEIDEGELNSLNLIISDLEKCVEVMSKIREFYETRVDFSRTRDENYRREFLTKKYNLIVEIERDLSLILPGILNQNIIAILNEFREKTVAISKSIAACWHNNLNVDHLENYSINHLNFRELSSEISPINKVRNNELYKYKTY